MLPNVIQNHSPIYALGMMRQQTLMEMDGSIRCLLQQWTPE